MELVLASSSERRKRILEECRFRFKVIPPDVREENGKDIICSVVGNARLKALKVSAETEKAAVLGADTLVLFEDRIIGKPAGYSEAKKLLESFRGKTLKVYTGLFAINGGTGKSASGWDETVIGVRRFSKRETPVYLEHLGPFDKAGGFSVEGAGALIFDDIRGSYYNVLGLPMAELAAVLKAVGLDVFSFMR